MKREREKEMREIDSRKREILYRWIRKRDRIRCY